jgi:hypothetical protein
MDYKFKWSLLNFFDPCKSVLSVVRFGIFVQSRSKVSFLEMMV